MCAPHACVTVSLPGVSPASGAVMTRERESEIGAIHAFGPVAQPEGSKYERLIARAKGVPAAKTVIAHPCDESSLRGAVDAAAAGLITPILVGPADKIRAVAD